MTGTLKGRVIPTRDVEISDGESFSVRGIGLNDALAIYDRHRGEASAWFDKLAAMGDGSQEAVNLDQMSAVAEALVVSMPHLAAEIIAAGSGSLDDESIALAAVLPLGSTLDALTKVAELTFTRDMPPKKFLETVVRAVKGMLPPIPVQAA